MSCIEFLYNVFTRETGPGAGLAPEWWERYPHWNYYCRTNVRASWDSDVWLGGGGETEEEAVQHATQSVRLDAEKVARGDFASGVATASPPEARGSRTEREIKTKQEAP